MSGAIKSEVRKIFTTRAWWGTALGMVILAFLLAMAAGSLVNLGANGDEGFSSSPQSAMAIYNAGLLGNFGSLTALFPLALGVLLITTEYRHKTVTATYLATPRRTTVATAKVIAVLVVGLIYGVIHAIASIAGGAFSLTVFKHVDLFLSNGDVWASIGRGVLATAIWMLIGFGFGMLVRNQMVAILCAVAFGFLGQLLLNIVFALLKWWAAMKWIPGNLTTSMLVTSDPTAKPSANDNTQYFSWWVSALLLVLYALVLAGLGSVLAARRDVT